MKIKQLLKLLAKFDENAEVKISIEGASDFENILTVEENENGVWICAQGEGVTLS